MKTQEGSKDWWQKKYDASEGYLYGKAPSNFLVEHLHLLKRGETVDVGMGEGRNAVYLASKDFQVTGVDFIETAVERANTLAKDSGTSFNGKVQDLDFFLVPLMKYDSIIVCDFHPPITLMKGLTRGLKNGGTLLLEGYTMEQCKLGQGFQPDPSECFKPNEALALIKDLHLIHYSERRISDKEARVQLIAQKRLH